MALIEHDLGVGLAPDVSIIGGVVYVAWGTTEAVRVISIDRDGKVLHVRIVPHGFFNSFPITRGGPWLVYKGIKYGKFIPVATPVVGGDVLTVDDGKVDGNWGIIVNPELSVMAWQTAPNYDVTVVRLPSLELVGVLSAAGAPDGMDSLGFNGIVTNRNDIIDIAPDVGGYVQRADDMRVGQYGYGVGIKFDDEIETRWLWGGTTTSDPRCANEGDLYAVCAWGNTVRVAIGTREDFIKLRKVPGDEPEPPPPPPPPPPPQETSMQLPKPIYDTWVQVAEKFAHLHRGTDADRALATRYGVQTIRFRHKGGEGPLDGSRYVHKTEHGNMGSPSKDAIGYVDPDWGPVQHGRLSKMHMFDMIAGGARTTNKYPISSHNFEPGEHHNPDAYIILDWPEGDAYDWLAGEPGPVDPGQPPDPGKPADSMTIDLRPFLKPLLEKIESLKKIQEEQAALIRKLLEQQPGSVQLPKFIYLKSTENNKFLSARVDLQGDPVKAVGEGQGPYERFEFIPE